MTSKLKSRDSSAAAHELLSEGFLSFTQRYPDTYKAFSFTLGQGLSCYVLDSGVLLIEPEEADQSDVDIVLSSGVHGNETGPIELLDKIVSDIFNGDLYVNHRLLLIIGNPQASIQQKRFIDENLNRLFASSGEENSNSEQSNSLEAQRARKLKQYMAEFFVVEKHRVHYDLHTAIRGSLFSQFVLYPYQDGNTFDYQALSIFKLSGIETVLLGNQASSTFSYYSSHHYHADAFTVELGQVKPFGENDFSTLEKLYENLRILISKGVNTLSSYTRHDDYRIFRVKSELIKKSEQFTLNVHDRVNNFQYFPMNYTVTHDIDGGYTTSADNEAIVFPNPNVPVGQRAGLMVVPIK